MKKKKSFKAILTPLALVGSLLVAGVASAAPALDFNGFATVRSGNSGGYVRALQANLYCFGLQSSVGSIDGSFGTGTYNALKSFQSSHGLTADGVAGSGTWRKMSEWTNVEVPNVSFQLWTGESSTYWALYGNYNNGSNLKYELMYKSNNAVVNSAYVY